MRRMMFVPVLLCWSIATMAGQPQSMATTRDLIAAMQKQYATSWYKTATFEQKTTNIAADGTPTVATWYEAIAVPGKLRIDIAPIADGNGILFADGKTFNIKAGKVQSSRPYVHPLLLLGFDVYKLPIDDVLRELSDLKFDLSVIHEDTWQSRPAYVVGAAKGDEHSAQFWIDRERLVFVRMIRPSGADGSHTQETQFNKYVKLGGGWMAPEVVFKTDGRVATTEEYSDLHADMTFDPKLFDPDAWSTSTHWKK
jgi:hypothetical protein